jgi:hypothetical protein
MLVSHYGGCLSQDRILYEFNHGSSTGDDPELDLAHYVQWSGETATTALTWALGFTADKCIICPKPPDETFLAADHCDRLCDGSSLGTGDFDATDLIRVTLQGSTDWPDATEEHVAALIESWTVDGRPLMIRRSGHYQVVNGYCEETAANEIGETTTVPWVHVLDPMLLPAWQRLSNWYAGVYEIWVGPHQEMLNELPTYTGPRSDESEMWTDYDGDGIMDFDEQNRFACDHQVYDTDYDKVPDKNDIRDYVFQLDTSVTGAPELVYSWRNPRALPTSERKENNRDRDGDGCSDGREDKNKNGIEEPGETSNFDPCDCSPPAIGPCACGRACR